MTLSVCRLVGPLPLLNNQRHVTFETFDQSDEDLTKKAMTKTNTITIIAILSGGGCGEVAHPGDKIYWLQIQTNALLKLCTVQLCTLNCEHTMVNNVL